MVFLNLLLVLSYSAPVKTIIETNALPEVGQIDHSEIEEY